MMHFEFWIWILLAVMGIFENFVGIFLQGIILRKQCQILMRRCKRRHLML